MMPLLLVFITVPLVVGQCPSGYTIENTKIESSADNNETCAPCATCPTIPSCPTPIYTTCPSCPPISAHCESGWTHLDSTDFCYKPFYSQDFNNAEKSCNNVGAHLASVHTEEENSFIFGLVHPGHFVDAYIYTIYIGLHRDDHNSNWKWTDGSNVDFTDWAASRPHSNKGYDCAYINIGGNGDRDKPEKWDNSKCDYNSFSFVCKKPALH